MKNKIIMVELTEQYIKKCQLLNKRGEKVAIIWESDTPNESKKITFNQLHDEVCKFANGLKSLGVKKGDRVTIYLPMIPEAAYAMLACARIGAIHSVVFGGFAPDSLKDRIIDCGSSIIITANKGLRGGKIVPLLSNVYKATKNLDIVKNIVVVNRTNKKIEYQKKDVSYEDLVSNQSTNCEVTEQNSEDPLFILYIQINRERKGVLHTSEDIYCMHQ